MKCETDYTLYIVTDCELMSAASIEDAVESAIKGGCTMVQLREKTASPRELYEQALAVKRITDARGVPLIINDRVDIALAVDACGVHVGQSDIPAGIARRLIGPDKLLGISASNLEQALAAERAGADYLGVGAMFATDTKTDAQITSMEELRRIRLAVGLPIVAIGGINKQTAPMLRGGDIDGLAVASAVLSQPDIEAAARELKDIFLAVPEKGRITAAIFDMDGTLIDSMGVWGKIDVEFLGKRGFEVPPDYVTGIAAMSFREAAEYTAKRFGLTETADSIMREWNEMAEHEYTHNIGLKPGVRQYLESLRSQGIRLALATCMMPELCRAALEKNGITGFFDYICTTDMVKRSKLFPDMFLHTARLLDTPPQNCIVFDDLPQAIASAKRAGMTVYAVYDEASARHWESVSKIADGVIRDFGADAPQDLGRCPNPQPF